MIIWSGGIDIMALTDEHNEASNDDNILLVSPAISGINDENDLTDPNKAISTLNECLWTKERYQFFWSISFFWAYFWRFQYERVAFLQYVFFLNLI